MRKGIDISSYQPSVDFEAVKGDGIEVVYIKATEGISYVNPYLQSHATAAKTAGLLVGVYHFFRAKTVENAQVQAKFFVGKISSLAYDCRLALDLETTEGLNKNTLNSCTKAVLDEIVSLTGTTPVLYSYTSFIKSYLSSDLTAYPLWVADYRSGSPGANSVWDSWIGWQYSSTGSVSGIAGNVDMDQFTDDILIEDTAFIAAVNQLVADKVIASPDYWINSVANNTPVRGDWMATVIGRMVSSITNDTSLSNALSIMKDRGVIADPSYWLANAVEGKTCNPKYVRTLIVNGVHKLGL